MNEILEKISSYKIYIVLAVIGTIALVAYLNRDKIMNFLNIIPKIESGY